MAGGGSSWQDLALYLIARFVGLKEAIEVAKVYMLQWHDLGQQPFAALTGQKRSADAMVNDCQAWLAENYRVANPVAAMVARAGLPERSFIRRFSKATGMTPLDYVQALRLEEAKQSLETATCRWRPSPRRSAIRTRASSAGSSAARSASRRSNTACASARCGGPSGPRPPPLI